jgi:excisionase family DNA binding protein
LSERLLTAREAADHLGFAPATIVKWSRAGKIPSFKVGGRLRFRQSELDEHLEGMRRSSNRPLGVVR